MSEQLLREMTERRWVTLVPTVCDVCRQHRACDTREEYMTLTLTGEVYATVQINVCYDCEETQRRGEQYE